MFEALHSYQVYLLGHIWTLLIRFSVAEWPCCIKNNHYFITPRPPRTTPHPTQRLGIFGGSLESENFCEKKIFLTSLNIKIRFSSTQNFYCLFFMRTVLPDRKNAAPPAGVRVSLSKLFSC